jgi:hypothetical protein
MQDATEEIRKAAVQTINAGASDREMLEEEYGQVWDTTELQRDFEVQSFFAPFVFVRRKSDGTSGSLMFRHSPRFYFCFNPSSN